MRIPNSFEIIFTKLLTLLSLRNIIYILEEKNKLHFYERSQISIDLVNCILLYNKGDEK